MCIRDSFYRENAPRGEFVLVVAGAQPPQPEAWTLEEAAALARSLAAGGASAAADVYKRQAYKFLGFCIFWF